MIRVPCSVIVRKLGTVDRLDAKHRFKMCVTFALRLMTRNCLFLMAPTLALAATCCSTPTKQSVSEVPNGPFKIDIRAQEFHKSGIHNVDVCVADTTDKEFPDDAGQCFLHGFDFSGLSVAWLSKREIQISFGCGRVSKFSNFAILSRDRPVPIEFHATLQETCGKTW